MNKNLKIFRINLTCKKKRESYLTKSLTQQWLWNHLFEFRVLLPRKKPRRLDHTHGGILWDSTITGTNNCRVSWNFSRRGWNLPRKHRVSPSRQSHVSNLGCWPVEQLDREEDRAVLSDGIDAFIKERKKGERWFTRAKLQLKLRLSQPKIETAIPASSILFPLCSRYWSQSKLLPETETRSHSRDTSRLSFTNFFRSVFIYSLFSSTDTARRSFCDICPFRFDTPF